MKKLYKSNQNKVIAGVCGGIAEYFNIDPTIIRLAWVLFCLIGGSGVLGYIICALVIPSVINSETSMTYLGIINLSDFAGTTIGTLISQGNAAMTAAPHGVFWPSLYLSLLLISFNLFGNGLRDAFNPSTRGAED